MKRISVEQAFLWSQRFVAREWRLLLPVALAFLALPALLMDVLLPDSARELLVPLHPPTTFSPEIYGVALLASFLVLLLVWVGMVALVALALVPRISVAEALGLGLRRLGSMVVIWLMFVGILLLATLTAAIAIGLAPIDLAAQQKLLVGVSLGVFLFVGVRAAMTVPVLVEGRTGAVTAVCRAWALSRGIFWRLFGAYAIYLIGASVVLLALLTAIGTLFTLGAKATGLAELGVILITVTTRVGMAALLAGLPILTVGIYRQLAGTRNGM